MGKFLDFYRIRLEEVILEKLWVGEEITDPLELEILEEARQTIEKKTNVKIYWDQSDRQYLHQVPKSLWAEAMRYRYDDLVYKTWLRSTSQQYFQNATAGDEKHKLAFVTDQMSAHGTAEQVAEWVQGPKDWDFIQLGKRLYFVNTGGIKLLNKLKKLSLDPEFDKKNGQVQWKGYEPPAKMANQKAGTLSNRLNKWQQMSSEGWYSQDDDSFFDFKEIKGIRYLSSGVVRELNNRANPNRRAALLHLIAQKDQLIAKGIKFDPKNYGGFVDQMMFGQEQDFRVYPYITENGNVDSTKDRLVALQPAKEVDRNALEAYNNLKKEAFTNADLEALRKDGASFNQPIEALEKEREELQSQQSKKGQRVPSVERKQRANARKIKIRKILDDNRHILLGPDANPGDVKLNFKNKEQYPKIIQILKDNGVFTTGNEELKQQKKELVQNAKTVTPADMYATNFSDEQLATFLGIIENPDWEQQVAQFQTEAATRTKGFHGNVGTGLSINYHRSSVYENHDLAERWKKEPVHYKAFIHNDEDFSKSFISKIKPRVTYPWDQISTGSHDSPAYWGLARASSNSKVTRSTDTTETGSEQATMLITKVNPKIISNLGKPVFEKYFAAYDAWQNESNKSEIKSKIENDLKITIAEIWKDKTLTKEDKETKINTVKETAKDAVETAKSEAEKKAEINLQNAYTAAATEVKTLATQFMHSHRQKEKVHKNREEQAVADRVNNDVNNTDANTGTSKEDKIFANFAFPLRGKPLSTEDALKLVKKLVGPIDNIITDAKKEADSQVRWLDQEQSDPPKSEKNNRQVSILYHLRHYQILHNDNAPFKIDGYTYDITDYIKNINVDELVIQEIKEQGIDVPQTIVTSPMVKIYIKEPQKYKEQKMKDAKAELGNTATAEQIENRAYEKTKIELSGFIHRSLLRMRMIDSEKALNNSKQEVQQQLDTIFDDSNNAIIKNPVDTPQQRVKASRGLGGFRRAAEPVPTPVPIITKPQPEALPIQPKTGPKIQRTLF
jgi:hypothetical protein